MRFLKILLAAFFISSWAHAAVTPAEFRYELGNAIQVYAIALSDSMNTPDPRPLANKIRELRRGDDYRTCTRHPLLTLFSSKLKRIVACQRFARILSDLNRTNGSTELAEVETRLRETGAALDKLVADQAEGSQRRAFTEQAKKTLLGQYRATYRGLEEIVSLETQAIQSLCSGKSLRKTVKCAVSRTVGFLELGLPQRMALAREEFSISVNAILTSVKQYQE